MTESLKELTRQDADVMSAMTMACGIGSETALQGALSAVADSSAADVKLRGYAAMAVGMTGAAQKTAQELQQVYRNCSENPDVQRGAVLGIGLVGDRRDVGFLLDVLKTDRSKPFSHYTRGAAVMALGLIRDGESVPAIQNLLRDSDAYVRAYAIAALGYLADKDPVPVLPSLFEHSNFRQEFEALQIAMRTL
jgi:HEAT repeat protein